jgi:hypothetical protein
VTSTLSKRATSITIERKGVIPMTPLDQAYFEWLCSQVGPVRLQNNSKASYWKLLEFLYKKEFTWKIERDANRASDGQDLRYQFTRETGNKADTVWMSMPCSFLEMLYALAFAVAFEGGGEPSERFWELIHNVGLTGCTDRSRPSEAIVDHMLNKIMDRDYNENGAGGLFPLNNPTQDQRGVELWYQAQAYLLERL